MVFQQFNLFPHLTALQNITLGPIKALGLSKKDTTVQGVKLKPLTKIDAFNYSVKKNYLQAVLLL